MGKLTKGDNTETTNGEIPVVTPSNMGVGLGYNQGTNKYDVNVNHLVSPLADNQIKVRDGKIYYGFTAKEELRDLYISNNGNDSNLGTREAPLRTIQAAFDKLENTPVFYHIWLHEGHTFDWVIKDISFTNIIIDVYGDTVDSTYPMTTRSNAYYRGYVAKSFPRPTINVRVKSRYNMIMRDHLISNELTIRGVRINIHNKCTDPDDGTLSGHFTGIFDSKTTVTIHGCIINEVSQAVRIGSGSGAYRDDVIFRAPRILWIDSICETLPRLVSSSYTSQISMINWNNGNLRGSGEKPDHESLTPAENPVAVMTRRWKDQIYGVEYDEATKSIFGMVINWNIFNTN